MFRMYRVLLLLVIFNINYYFIHGLSSSHDYLNPHHPVHTFGLAKKPPNFTGSFLINHVLNNVSRNFRPVKDQRYNTTVFFRLLLYQILGANSIQGKIHLHFWVEMLWQNEFVSWNPIDHANITRVDLHSQDLWIPDIIFFTQLTGQHLNQEFPSQPALLFDGLTMVLKPFKAELVCVMNVWFFPYDRQICEFDVGSWAHLASEIDIRPKEEGAADMMFFQRNSEFAVVDFQAKYKTYVDPHLNFMGSDYLFRRNKSSTPVTSTQKTVTVAELSCLTFSLTFERRPTYYLLNVIFPSVLINLLCLFNFIIPCETGEKVTYGMTVFLAQSVNLMVVSEMMPQGGVSVLGIFLLASLFMIAFSLLMQVLTMSVFFASSSSRAPRKVRILCEKFRKIVGPSNRQLSTFSSTTTKPAEVLTNVMSTTHETQNGSAFGWSQRRKDNPVRSDFTKQQLTSPLYEPIASINIDGASYNQSSRGETWKQNLYFGVQEPESWLSMNRGETTSGSARYSQSYYPQDLSGSCCEDFGQRNDRPMSISVAGRRSSSYMPNMATHAPEYFPFDQLKPSMIISNLTQQNLKSNGTFSRLDHRDGISESQIISEWRMIANVQNRVNAIFFCWLLFGILCMYYRSHAPSN